MTKILITGGAGFIGSNLCEFFLNEGYFVRCLDNFSTGFKSNIEDLLQNENFELITGDIRDLETCRLAVKDCTYVLHEAALGSVPRSIDDPITSNDVNVSGFLNMLTASKDEKVNRFIYAASSSTYGDSEALPKTEDVIGKPLSPYAVTKYVNELYADVFKKIYDLDTVGLRYFNVFGKKQNPNGAYAAAIPKFINQFIQGEDIIINGDGEYSRDFTYIQNVIQMNKLALLTEDPSSLNKVYNTAFGERNTLNNLIETIRVELSKYLDVSKTNIIHGPNRKGDVPHSLASIDRAKSLLKYEPTFSLQEGLSEYVKWYVSTNLS